MLQDPRVGDFNLRMFLALTQVGRSAASPNRRTDSVTRVESSLATARDAVEMDCEASGSRRDIPSGACSSSCSLSRSCAKCNGPIPRPHRARLPPTHHPPQADGYNPLTVNGAVFVLDAEGRKSVAAKAATGNDTAVLEAMLRGPQRPGSLLKKITDKQFTLAVEKDEFIDLGA